MLFSSIPFLYTFLPCVLILYFLVPGWLKNTVLLLSSLFFYAWGEPRFVVFMVIAIVQGYVFGLLAEKFRDRPKRAKLCLWASAVVSLGLLGYCKYADFFISGFNTLTGLSLPLLHVALPIGISFYTFQTMSYTIDVYRGDAKVQNNIISFGAYVALFPQLIAGPIVRYQTIADQVDERVHSFDKFGEGAKRFICGLGKKVLLANNIGLLWDTISKTEISNLSVLSAWLGIFAFAFQIYFDFSGYSDMAIGLSRFFGFDFKPNFDHPYTATSVQDFWIKWHISLSQWFRDYLYIPLGGNRVDKNTYIRNIFIVWFCTGLWHGANWTFILWGLYYGCLLLLEKFFLREKLEKLPKPISHIYTLLVILIGWVFFMSSNITTAFSTLGKMISIGTTTFANNQAKFMLKSYFLLFILAILLSTKVYDKIQIFVYNQYKMKAVYTTWTIYIILIIVCIAFIVGGTYHSFLYFAF